MAVRNVSDVINENGVRVVTWADVDNGDTGRPVATGNYQDISVQRTAGAGTIAMEGSNDGTLFGALGTVVAPDGTIKRIVERPLQLRPSVSAGDNSTVVMIMSNYSRA